MRTYGNAPRRIVAAAVVVGAVVAAADYGPGVYAAALRNRNRRPVDVPPRDDAETARIDALRTLAEISDSR